MTSKRKFGELERDLPETIALASDAFHKKMMEHKSCSVCNVVYLGNSLGSQRCSFHPFQYYNRGTNLMGLYSIDNPPPTACKICCEFHLRTCHAKAEQLAEKNRGCVRIDHSTSLQAILQKPYEAIPLEHIVLLEMYNAMASMIGSNSFPLVLKALLSRRDVLLIHKAKHLGKTLQMGYPGTQRLLTVPIVDVYEEMAANFSLTPLYSEVAKARAANPLTRITKQPDVNPDARRKDALRMMNTRRVSFVQFVIIARIQQNTNGRQDMKCI